MNKYKMILALILLLPLAASCSQDFSGEYKAVDAGLDVDLTLEQEAGRISGMLIADGAIYSVNG